MDRPRLQLTAFLSVNHIPPLPIPHRLEYPLCSRMHFDVVHPRLEARGRPFPRSPWSRTLVNLRVLRPMTRGSQGQPSPLRTPHGRPGVQGIFPTFRGQVPHGWPMVHNSMATGSPIPQGLLLGAFDLPAHPMSHSPWPHPGTGPFPASHGLPTSSGRCAALATRLSPPSLLVPSSCAYTPLGRQQTCGAGPLDPLTSGDHFVRLARVAPFPPPSLSPVPRPRPNPLGCCAAPSHPSSRVYTPPGRQQRCGAGPLDPHPSGDRFVRPARVAPLPPPPSLLCRRPCCPSHPGPSRGPSHTPFSVPSPCGAAGCCSRFFSLFAVLFSAWFPPPCMHAQQHCIAVCLGSIRCSRPVPPPSCGAALGGPWPCQVGAPPSRPSLLARVVVRLSSFSPLHPPLTSVSCPPSQCCSPAPRACCWSAPSHGCISRALTRL